MRLPRPHISTSIKIAVIERQIAAAGRSTIVFTEATKDKQLAGLLRFLFGDNRVHLDHMPALALRKKVFDRAGKHVDYEPRAADPEYLLYRLVDEHKRKTNGIRGDGAEFSDRVLIKKQRRIERGPRPKRGPKIQSRGFAKPVGKTRWPKRPLGRAK